MQVIARIFILIIHLDDVSIMVITITDVDGDNDNIYSSGQSSPSRPPTYTPGANRRMI